MPAALAHGCDGVPLAVVRMRSDRTPRRASQFGRHLPKEARRAASLADFLLRVFTRPIDFMLAAFVRAQVRQKDHSR